MLNRKSIRQNKHYRRRKKKASFNEFMLNIVDLFSSINTKKKKYNIRKRKHKHEAISKEVAFTDNEKSDDKKTLAQFQKEKPVKPIFLNSEFEKKQKKSGKQEPVKAIDAYDVKKNIVLPNAIIYKEEVTLNDKEHKKEQINRHFHVDEKDLAKFRFKGFDLRKKSLMLMCICSSGFILFYLVPFIFSIYYSLINNAFDKKFVFLSNYIQVIKNQYFRLALRNTFEFTFIGVGILIPVSFVLSIIIVNLSKSMNFVKPAFFIPMLLPTASVIIIWKILFGDYSYINAFLHNNTGRIPIYLLFLWKNCGYNIILFSAAFLSVDKYIYEAASLDGVNIFQKHLYITLPLILPTVFFVFIISLVNSFKIFKEVYLFYGTYYPEQNLYLVQHYMKNHFDKLNYQNLTTGAIIFAIIVYIIVAVGYKMQAKVASEAWY